MEKIFLISKWVVTFERSALGRVFIAPYGRVLCLNG
jgi:hypothetical protein